LINALVNPLNDVIDRVNTATEKLSRSEDFLQSTQENALAVATQEFFMGKGMVPARETYGTEVKDLTDEQTASRMELFGQADIIIAGASDHGKDISVQDALERAHIILSQGTRDEIIRQEIRDNMKKRTKTMKSSHQKSPVTDTDQDVPEEELEKRVAASLRAIKEK